MSTSAMARRIPRLTVLASVAVLAAVAVGAPAARADASPPPGTPTAHTFDGTPTVGPLYPDATSDRHSCSASVVASQRGDVLLTAAHCVSGTGAGDVFAPGFHGGVSPYGRWTVTAAYLAPGWLRRQNPRDDFAFLTVAPQNVNGRSTEIQAVTGANRLGFGAAPGERVTVPAYPAGTDNDPVTCTTSVYFKGVFPAFNCNPYVGGTSGSPWLLNGAHGPTVVGIIAGLHQGGCYSWTSYSSRLGTVAHRAFRRAALGAAPDTAPSPGSDGCS